MKITFLWLLRSWYTFHMEKSLVSWWEHRLLHTTYKPLLSIAQAPPSQHYRATCKRSLTSRWWVLADCTPGVPSQAKPEHADFKGIFANRCMDLTLQNTHGRGMLTTVNNHRAAVPPPQEKSS